MVRTVRTALLAVVMGSAMVGPAAAQTQAPAQAEALNEEGKELYKKKDFAGAAAKFRAAIAVSPDARYYFNLCATLEKTGEYDAALEACDEVYARAPSDELKAKTGQRAAEIRAKKRKAAQDGGGGGGANPGGGDGGGGGGPDGGGGGMVGGGGPPPEGGIEEQVEPGLNYKWGISFEMGPIRTGLGDDSFSRGGGILKLNADYLVWPRKRIGVEGYLNITGGGEGTVNDTGNVSQLSIVEIGAGLYRHLRLGRNFYLTGLAGAHLASIQPQITDSGDSFGTVGIRLEAGLDWILSEHHVITVVPFALGIYLPPGGQFAGGATPEDFGLDAGGVVYSFTIGYNYRSTKLVPQIVTLE